jgi:hypothetical protein
VSYSRHIAVGGCFFGMSVLQSPCRRAHMEQVLGSRWGFLMGVRVVIICTAGRSFIGGDFCSSSSSAAWSKPIWLRITLFWNSRSRDFVCNFCNWSAIKDTLFFLVHGQPHWRSQLPLNFRPWKCPRGLRWCSHLNSPALAMAHSNWREFRGLVQRTR